MLLVLPLYNEYYCLLHSFQNFLLHSLKMAGNQDSLDSMTFLCCLTEIIATSYSPFESCALFHFVLLLRISVPTFHLSSHYLSASLDNFLMSSTLYVILRTHWKQIHVVPFLPFHLLSHHLTLL